MGDIADDIIDGIFDYETGEYLGEGVGYPRRLSDMKPDFTPKAKRWHPSNASKDTIIVWNLLKQKGIHFESERNKTVKDFAKFKNANLSKVNEICKYIRNGNWFEFKEYIKTPNKKL